MSTQHDVIDALSSGHWPYSAERSRITLDLDSIESQAARVLARGLRTQRLVAFVGAGVSMAYGRMTWGTFIEAVYDHLKSEIDAGKAETPLAHAVFDKVCNRIWPEKKDFLQSSAWSAKATVLASIFELQRQSPAKSDAVSADSEIEGERAIQLPAIKESSSRRLSDHGGFVQRLIDTLESLTPGVESEAQSNTPGQHGGSKGDPARGLGGVLQLLLQSREAAKAPLKEGFNAALDVQSLEDDSPLRHLILEWGVRRFLTTNYDREIERALEQFQFLPHSSNAGVVHANQHVVLNFDKRQTGRAVAFAVEGPRRHAVVMHLHGRASQPESMVVTSSDYQDMYVDDHPARDLVTNATLANFAANPVLFVGSDVSESDVLHPLRQFISAQGHRRDRMTVALLAAHGEPGPRMEKQLLLRQDYGIHAVYFGQARHSSGASLTPLAGRRNDEFWLERFAYLCREIRQGVDRSGRATAADGSYSKPLQAISGLIELPVPDSMEGLSLSEASFGTAFTSHFGSLQQLAAECRSNGSNSGDSSAQGPLGLLRLICEVMLDWTTTLFLCAKLETLHQRALRHIRDDSALALAYVRPQSEIRDDRSPLPAGEICAQVEFRHRVVLGHPLLVSRFERPNRLHGEREEWFDDGIQDLCEQIKATPELTRAAGRRVVLVCSPRGHGKGGQSDRLVSLKPEASGSNAQRGGLPATTQGLYIEDVLAALGGYAFAAQPNSYVLHINLSFSNELGPIISQVSALLQRIYLKRFPPGSHDSLMLDLGRDQLEQLERGLLALTLAGGHPCRLMIILGNAGVLFDEHGRPKNGQIARVLRLLMSHRFSRAPLDLLLYVGESQVPHELRRQEPPGEPMNPGEDARRPLLNPDIRDHRRRRRMDRLNIRRRADHTLMHVFPLKRARLIRYAAAYFQEAARGLKWLGVDGTLAGRHSEPDHLARRIYQAAGGSRLALSMLLALFDASVSSKKGNSDHLNQLAEEALTALDGPPMGSVVETAIEFVLDRWQARHVLGHALKVDHLPTPRDPECRTSKALLAAMSALTDRPSAASWGVLSELLWHLGAFSHPVEAEVLFVCPGVQAALARWREVTSSSVQGSDILVVRAGLELLTHWCLIFRIDRRPLGPEMRQELDDLSVLGADSVAGRLRYAPHRHMERHLIRLMGGRNVETTHWDQFTTTIYASLPDEAPVLRKAAHRALTEVVRELTAYPQAQSRRPAFAALRQLSEPTQMMLEADFIRAAYYLLRTTYSLGVVAHLAPDSHDEGARCGHMEQYRRLVRWITHAARYWEYRYGLTPLPDPIERDGLLPDARLKSYWSGDAEVQKGVFYPGELIWLYAESGVISLAQGKLQDAEHLLTMAENAARMVETDNSGSLHTRIRIHTALVQIERGRPHRARQILAPIAARLGGHRMPPLLARYYLGLIDHLGGNYPAALHQYESVLDDLKRDNRSRACAFLMLNLADLQRVMHRDGIEKALVTCNQAISLAQQGGHEDLRMQALLGRMHLLVEAGQLAPEFFEQMAAAERYATRMDIPRIACDVLDLRARYLFNQGEFTMSARDATKGLEIAALYDMKLRKARGLLTLARILERRGELASALALVKMGRELAASCDYYTCVRGFKELDLSLQRMTGPEAS